MKPYLAAFVAFAFTGPALAAALLHDATVINYFHYGRQTTVRVDPDGIATPVAVDSAILRVAATGGRQHCRLQRVVGTMAGKAAKATPATA
jgi:hypothetical protein